MAKFLLLVCAAFFMANAQSQVALSSKANFDSANVIAYIEAQVTDSNSDNSAFNSKAKPIAPEMGPKEAWKIYKKHLYRVYGRRTLKREMPYYYYSYKEFYYYQGHLKENWVGGTFVLIVSATSGKIVHLTHYK